jgi:hypothetical protein
MVYIYFYIYLLLNDDKRINNDMLRIHLYRGLRGNTIEDLLERESSGSGLEKPRILQ